MVFDDARKALADCGLAGAQGAAIEAAITRGERLEAACELARAMVERALVVVPATELTGCPLLGDVGGGLEHLPVPGEDPGPGADELAEGRSG